MRLINHLTKAIRDAAIFNSEVQVKPACILWPDRDRQWVSVIPIAQAEMPELFVLGDFDPESRTGPAIWLRCVLAGLTDIQLNDGLVPIIYLPGVGRQNLRAVENCPEHLKPLAELQYRGVIWSQVNAKDWTILAFLKSDQGGLGLDVAQDNGAKNAMQLALPRLLGEDLSLLRGKRLDQDYFNTMLSGGDPVRELLNWLNQGDAFRASRSEGEWKAFVQVIKSMLGFDAHNEGILAGYAKFAAHEGPWMAVWERFCEAPHRYPNIPVQIRKCPPPQDTLLWRMGGRAHEGWPQWNDEQENALRDGLMGLKGTTPQDARRQILDFEKQHGNRRLLVWAELGEAPLARALGHLRCVAEITTHSMAVGTIDDLVSTYRMQGWRADDAVLRALAEVERPQDVEAVIGAIRTVYLPWMEDSARYLQKLVDSSGYPGGTRLTAPKRDYGPGDCILFVDGLRFDVGQRLVEAVENTGFALEETSFWNALPSVTATGKPAASPVVHKIEGKDESPDFDPSVSETGQSLKGGYHLKKLMIGEGWTILEDDLGDGVGKGWHEYRQVDHEGHERGWKLAKHIDVLVAEIRDRIRDLFRAGWKRIVVVTDHGWLLMPGGLPEVNLHNDLAENKWGRCAALKAGASTSERLFPWFWNPSQHFALADGVSCFKKGREYTHGGLSLQECLTQRLTVTPGELAQDTIKVEISDIVWKGLRCTVVLEANFEGLVLDVRLHPGNASSSLVVNPKPIKENGTSSVVVEDEDQEGREAFIVLLNAQGVLVAQIATYVGGT